jgi:hypothetical protein
MKRLAWATVAWILLGGAIAIASASQGKGKKHAQQNGASHNESKKSETSVSVDVVFGPAEVVILRDHYAPRYRRLPPGLQKKVARGRQLPPGWQKEFESFPVSIERQLVVLPHGYRRGVIDGHAVIFNSGSNVIVDVAVLF